MKRAIVLILAMGFAAALPAQQKQPTPEQIIQDLNYRVQAIEQQRNAAQNQLAIQMSAMQSEIDRLTKESAACKPPVAKAEEKK